MSQRVSWGLGRGCGLALLAATLGTSPVSAQEGDTVSIHGAGGVAFGVTDETNAYLAGTPERSLDLREFSLTLLATPSERLLVGAQAYWGVRDIFRPGELDLNLNLAFAQYKVSDGLKIRAGLSRQPFGLYSETLEVGTLRPFLSLPRGVYSPGNFQTEGYRGLGATGVLGGGTHWPVEYDVYVGELELPGASSSLLESLAPGEEETQKLKDVVGGRLRLKTPVNGLGLGVSYYTANPATATLGLPPERQHSVLGSLELLRDSLSLRTEYARRTGSGGSADAAYVEAAYRPASRFELAARWDWFDANLEALVLPPFLSTILEHRDVAVGLNYYAASGLVFKASFHDVKGNLFAAPQGAVDFARGETLDSTTRLFQLGAQFSF